MRTLRSASLATAGGIRFEAVIRPLVHLKFNNQPIADAGDDSVGKIKRSEVLLPLRSPRHHYLHFTAGDPVILHRVVEISRGATHPEGKTRQSEAKLCAAKLTENALIWNVSPMPRRCSSLKD